MPAYRRSGLMCYRQAWMMVTGGLARAVPIPSPSCGLSDLADAHEDSEEARRELACGAGWENRWEACAARILSYVA
jgi:hypothetical protein